METIVTFDKWYTDLVFIAFGMGDAHLFVEREDFRDDYEEGYTVHQTYQSMLDAHYHD
jgi:hypothetical protein